MAAEEGIDEEGVFVDEVKDVPVDEGIIHNNEPGLLKIVDEQTSEEDEVILDAVHVDAVDEAEAPKPSNTNNNSAEIANDGNAPTQQNAAETATDNDASIKSRFGRPLRRPRFHDPVEGYQFSAIGDNENTAT